jgi:hypothetical protein
VGIVHRNASYGLIPLFDTRLEPVFNNSVWTCSVETTLFVRRRLRQRRQRQCQERGNAV